MKKVRCPICEKGMALAPGRLVEKPDRGGVLWPHWPFCSRRCQLIDLGRWLAGEYRIAAPLAELDGGDADGEHDNASKPAVPSADSHSHEAPCGASFLLPA
jgi:uncharacterized protein